MRVSCGLVKREQGGGFGCRHPKLASNKYLTDYVIGTKIELIVERDKINSSTKFNVRS